MHQISTKQYKTRHDWVGKLIDYVLCKKLEFDHMNKYHMYHPEHVPENKTNSVI